MFASTLKDNNRTECNDMYTCKRCGYSTDRKHNLLLHFHRKVPCKETNEDVEIDTLIEELNDDEDKRYGCDKCGKYFKTRQGKCKHKKTCEGKPNDMMQLLQSQQREIEELKRAIKDVQGSTKTTTVNGTMNVNNGTVNNINIQLRNFGEENRDAIPLHLIRSRFMTLEFRELFENLHCDPEYPENHNVRIKSVKKDLLEIYDNDRWNTTTSLIGMKKIVGQLYKLFDDFRKEHKEIALEDMNEDELTEIQRQLKVVGEWVHNTEAK